VNGAAAWLARPHVRYNPLVRAWVLVSPQRVERPWQGEIASARTEPKAAYHPHCYLCPGNERAGGARNPRYGTTFVFDNDYAALVPDAPAGELDLDGLLIARAEPGICRVVCFTPRHDLSVSQMTTQQIRQVVDSWAEQTIDLGAKPFVNSVTIFENYGEMMGASNPHPHAQIWSNATIPSELRTEQESLLAYRAKHGTCLLCTYIDRELTLGTRVVRADEHVAVLVPFWATWPFEVLVAPRRHARSLDELDGAERDALAEAMRTLTSTYDRLFDAPFPYSMGFHQRPTDGAPHDEWHLHGHYLPPLLRSATVRKYMVGYEMLGMPQRDITPEAAAERLRVVSANSG
jgi:UDPglucose--hexose-1-phosphate uridylyltransferase